LFLIEFQMYASRKIGQSTNWYFLCLFFFNAKTANLFTLSIFFVSITSWRGVSFLKRNCFFIRLTIPSYIIFICSQLASTKCILNFYLITVSFLFNSRFNKPSLFQRCQIHQASINIFPFQRIFPFGN